MESSDMYIYNLPLQERSELCTILDLNHKWEELGGRMGFNPMTMSEIRLENDRGRSPTDRLLSLWGQRNHTVLQLFIRLHEMRHYQAMIPLKRFVDPKFHTLMYNGAASMKQMIRERNKNEPCVKNLNIPKENFNDVKVLNTDASVPHVVVTGVSNRAQNVVSRENNESAVENGNLGANEMVRRLSNCSINSEGSNSMPEIPYQELEEATNCWAQNQILGRGGFGTVFKGIRNFFSVPLVINFT